MTPLTGDGKPANCGTRDGGDTMRNLLRQAIREVANTYGLQTVLDEVQFYCEERQGRALENDYPHNAKEWGKARRVIREAETDICELELAN